MSLKTQAKVLRVLQEQSLERVGGGQRVRVDVRVLAATNKDLQAEIRQGRFREDLFFRLSVVPVAIPPLRERREDIPVLAEHFMATISREYGRRIRRLTPEALARLQAYDWPGNVRELRNAVERLIIMGHDDRVTAEEVAFLGDGHQQGALRDPAAEAGSLRLSEARDAFEREFILRTLARAQGNMSRTADLLGLERSNLYKKMRAFGILPRRDGA